MKARIKAIEKFAKCGTDFTRAKTGETCGLLLEFETPCEECGKPTYNRFCCSSCAHNYGCDNERGCRLDG